MQAAAFPARRRGFTMIEMLCVVVVLGIASAIIIPQVGARSDLEAASAARVVMSDLIYAQNRAINTQQFVYVAFNPSGNSYAVCSGVNPTTYLNNPLTHSSYVTTFGAGGTPGLADCSLASAGFGGQTIIAFDELGAPYACTSAGVTTSLTVNGTIVVGSGTNQLTITIQPDTAELTVQ